MMSGNGGDSSPSGTYRCPSLLMNWGPGLESRNPDMIDRLFDQIQSLSGKNTSDPSYMSALIDEDYSILDTATLRNAIHDVSGWHQDTSNDYLNFIALEDSVSGDILLMVVNDSDDLLSHDYIKFPDYMKEDYTISWVAGFELDTDTPEAETKVVMDFDMIPAFTASLYLIELE